MNLRQFAHCLLLVATLASLTACGGGGSGDASSNGNNTSSSSNNSGNNSNDSTDTQAGNDVESNCTGACAAGSPTNLTGADVEKIIAQATQEAVARGAAATIAVADRVGNVLGLFRMTGAAASFTIESGTVNTRSGLENIDALPPDLAAIAKAVTGAYLASEGNAFSSRTASHIVQRHFSPHELWQPGGPLFGVQFSQLPCGDLVQGGTALGIGPRRSPLGLSADPGGMPLYKDGQVVGGIGVIADGVYGLDRNILDEDPTVASPPSFNDLDEIIAIAGSFGYEAPLDIRADRITVDGRTLRYSDADRRNLVTSPAAASFAAVNGVNGSLIADSLGAYYAGGAVRAGTGFGTQASGIQAADNTDAASDYAGLDAFVLTASGTNNNRFAPAAGAIVAGEQLGAAEVLQVMRSALDVANRARAQIRRPLNSQARVTISIVDANGNILAIARTRDAPMFGTDVSLQKARTATFFSSADAGAVLLATADANGLGYNSSIAQYVTDVRNFLGDTNALVNGIAFADRSGGNLSRPFYPDGIDGRRHGPLSKSHSNNPASNQWSPFSTGLQLDLIYNQLISHLTGGAPTDCTQIGSSRLSNGMQIFPGSVPIYKNGVLVGGIGVSGDGVDQDDMIAFLGVYNASRALGGDGIGDSIGEIGNAMIANRADTITPAGFTTALRYVQCPQNPFIGSSDNNVCRGK